MHTDRPRGAGRSDTAKGGRGRAESGADSEYARPRRPQRGCKGDQGEDVRGGSGFTRRTCESWRLACRGRRWRYRTTRRRHQPDDFLSDGDELDVGGVTLRGAGDAGPTHRGPVCFYGEGTVFTGDTLFKGSIGRFDLDGGSGPLLLGEHRVTAADAA